MIVDLITLLCYNNHAIAHGEKQRSHQKSKHIVRHFHLSKEVITIKDVSVDRVPLIDNIVDLLTKPLAQKVF